jgi:polysaccharide pyruvyl transferase WcaK-like protein
MLEATVRRLLRHNAAALLHVVSRPGMRTGLWQWQNVRPCRLPESALLGCLYQQCQRLSLRTGQLAVKALYSLAQVALERLLCPGHALDRFCAAFDGLYIAGGGNLNDVFPFELWARIRLIRAFRQQQKPVVLTGQQIGPFCSRWTRGSLQHALRLADFVGLREAGESLAVCQGAGLAANRYHVMGDDSLGLSPAPPSISRAFLRKYGLTPQRFIAANIRVAGYAPRHQRHVGDLAALLGLLSQRCGMPILIVPISTNEADSDLASGKRLAELLPDDRGRVFNEPGLTPADLKGVLGQAYGAVGVSYHFCSFALSQGTPTVSLHDGAYYEQKARGLSDFWGDRRLAASLADVASPAAADRVAAVLADGALRDNLRHRAAGAVQDWQAGFDEVVSARLFNERPAPAPLRHPSLCLETRTA